MKKFDMSRSDHEKHELGKFPRKWPNTVGRGKQRAEHIGHIKNIFPDAKRVLCLGCRHESEVLQFLKHGFFAAGLDFAGTETPIVRIGDAHNLLDYYEENKFDVVYSSHSMEHMSNPTVVLENIRKVASMGTFIVLPPFGEAGPSHCSVFDVMNIAEEEGLNMEAEELSGSPLMEDFKPLQPYELAFFENMDYRESWGRSIEMGLAFRW
mgnify:CR=1 FL=1